jgi:short subunit dehydrogenase-like uncharacterized protein
MMRFYLDRRTIPKEHASVMSHTPHTPTVSPIAVFGATGWTGSQIARLLNARQKSLVLVGRNEAKLEQLASSLKGDTPIHLADPFSSDTLEAAFADASIVLNTVGPFGDFGEPVVKAALAQGCHYLDTTGEQAFMARIRANDDGRARSAHRAVICGQAFEYAIGTCAAAMALDGVGGSCDLLETYYWTKGGQISPGTAKSIVLAMGQPALAWEYGRLVTEAVGAHVGEISFPGENRTRHGLSFGGGTALCAQALGDVGQARSYLVMGERLIRRIRRWGWLRPALRSNLVRKLANHGIDRRLPAPSDDAHFKVLAHAVNASKSHTVVVSGTGPYQITAAIAVEGAIRLQDANNTAEGVISTPEAFPASDFLASLAPFGVSVTES